MKVLLDTTYFLPAVGVQVEGISPRVVVDLMGRGHRIFLSELSLFELSAKGGRFVVEGKLEAERVLRGVRSIFYDERLVKVPFVESSVLFVAFELRRFVRDFIDCVILSSAVNCCDVLVTEDYELLGLNDCRSFRGLVRAENPKFKVLSLDEFLAGH